MSLSCGRGWEGKIELGQVRISAKDFMNEDFRIKLDLLMVFLCVMGIFMPCWLLPSGFIYYFF